MSAPFYAVGKYACKVIEQALGESSKGNPQFVMRFKVLGLVDPEDPAKFIPASQQHERTYYKSITEKTIEYFVSDLKSLGFKGSSFKELDPTMPTYHSFVGLDIDMWCNHKKDLNDELREEWMVARTAGPLEVKPIEPKKLRDLDNMFASI